MRHTEFENKIIAIVGMARSGLAAAEALTQLGASVRLYDSKPAEQLAEALSVAQSLGVEAYVGGAPIDYAVLDYLVTSPGVPKSSPLLQEAVAAHVPVLGEIEAAYRIARAPILAITGTNGKTTTTMLLGEMLKAAGIETYVAGNIAAGDIAMPLIKAACLTPPEAAIVAEISSFQLEWISTFRPKVAALLNITPDHGDRQTWDEYVAAKWRIFENMTQDDAAIVSKSLLRSPSAAAVPIALTWFGDNKLGLNLAEIKLPGQHNVENILAAAAMATAFGVGIEPIRQVATTFTGVVHRLEYVDIIAGITYVNNSMCTNAAAFQRSLEALPEPKIVIAGGVFKGGDVKDLAVAVMKNNVKALVLIGRSASEIAAAARSIGFEAISHAGTMLEAVTRATALASPGDTVLLAPGCASFDMFKDFEDRGNQFKAAVRGK